jgi:hypothetical protein
MAKVKAVVTSLEGIPEADHEKYLPGEGGKLYLDLEGIETDEHPAVAALVRAKKRETEGRVKAETSAREAREKVEALSLELENTLKVSIPKENADRLEQSYKQKLVDSHKELTDKYTGEITTLNGSLRKVLVENVALALSTDLAGESSEILLPHITKRLAVEMIDGEAITRVLDKDGKPSAATLEDLRKEFLTNKKFSAVLIGSKASGSGADGNTHASGAPVGRKSDVILSKLSPKQLAAELRARAGE